MDFSPLGPAPHRVLVICGNDAAGITVANVFVRGLAGHTVAVIEERIVSPRRITSFAAKRLRARGLPSLCGSLAYYGLRLATGRASPRRAYSPLLVTDNANDGRVHQAIREFRPDIVLIGFCGILDQETLGLFPRAYNVHPGVNPRYRGFGNIWALAEDNPDLLGYTIHAVEKEVDAGERVAVGKVAPRELDGVPLVDIDLPVAAKAARHLVRLLLGEERPSVPETYRDLPSRFYGVPTLKTWRSARRTLYRCMKDEPRHILITGASSGIGRAIALEYAAPGCALTLWGRDPSRLEDVAASCRAKGARTDVVIQDLARLDESRELLHRVDSQMPVDLAVLGAGISSGTLPDGGLEPVTDACRTMHVNATATVNMTGAMAEIMNSRGRGQIAILSSIAALYPLPDSSSYSASKIAVASYARALEPLFPGIVFSVVYPGYVETAMSRRLAGPKPMLWTVDRAAAHIRQRLEAKARRIVFPRLLALGSLALHLLPRGLALSILRRFAFTIRPDEAGDQR